MSDYRVNAGFEGDIDWCKCRWIVVWKELENSIAGLIGGYAGGGCFYEEEFFCEIEDGKIKREEIPKTAKKLLNINIDQFEQINL